MKRIKVAVLAGGPDAERNVSLMSGHAIAQALITLDTEFDVSYHIIDKLTINDLAAINADVFFPALHGSWGEGGSLQKLLELDTRPFVGSDSKAAYLAMDKILTKNLAAQIGIPTPATCELNSINDKCPLDLPLVLKPIDDGSSVDIRICKTTRELTEARKLLHPRRSRLMAEQYIPGRELTVGIIGNDISSIIEIVTVTEFYDYSAKYDSEETKYIVNPPDLSPEIITKLKKYSLDIFTAVKARDLARVDFRYYNDGSNDDTDSVINSPQGLWFLEINTMPGFTTHSLVPMGAHKTQGLNMPQLCKKLIYMALDRK